MHSEFVQEIVEDKKPPQPASGLTGWETIVFQLDDVPESDLSTAAIAP
jgi:hypothetical protein